MRVIFRSLVVAFALALVAVPGRAAKKVDHRIVIQVSQNDPGRMNLALANTQNAIKYYTSKGESVEVEIVAY